MRLLLELADLINKSEFCKDRLKLVYIQNFDHQIAQLLFSAADVMQSLDLPENNLESSMSQYKVLMNGGLLVGSKTLANNSI